MPQYKKEFSLNYFGGYKHYFNVINSVLVRLIISLTITLFFICNSLNADLGYGPAPMSFPKQMDIDTRKRVNDLVRERISALKLLDIPKAVKIDYSFVYTRDDLNSNKNKLDDYKLTLAPKGLRELISKESGVRYTKYYYIVDNTVIFFTVEDAINSSVWTSVVDEIENGIFDESGGQYRTSPYVSAGFDSRKRFINKCMQLNSGQPNLRKRCSRLYDEINCERLFGKSDHCKDLWNNKSGTKHPTLPNKKIKINLCERLPNDTPTLLDRTDCPIPKIEFKLHCNKKYDKHCNAQGVVDLPEWAEYCLHEIHMVSWNNAFFTIGGVKPNSIQYDFRATGGGWYEAIVSIGLVRKGTYNNYRCLPRRNWIPSCDNYLHPDCTNARRCQLVQPADRLKDKTCFYFEFDPTAKQIIRRENLQQMNDIGNDVTEYKSPEQWPSLNVKPRKKNIEPTPTQDIPLTEDSIDTGSMSETSEFVDTEETGLLPPLYKPILIAGDEETNFEPQYKLESSLYAGVYPNFNDPERIKNVYPRFFSGDSKVRMPERPIYQIEYSDLYPNSSSTPDKMKELWISPPLEEGGKILNTGDFYNNRRVSMSDRTAREKGLNKRLHGGYDQETTENMNVHAAVGGKIIGLNYPYGLVPGQDGEILKGITIQAPNGIRWTVFYIEPNTDIVEHFKNKNAETIEVLPGEVIGKSQNVSGWYIENQNNSSVTNHIHHHFTDWRGSYISIDGLDVLLDNRKSPGNTD